MATMVGTDSASAVAMTATKKGTPAPTRVRTRAKTPAPSASSQIDYGRLADRIGLLGDPTRLQILHEIMLHPGVTVGELGVRMGKHQAAVSHYLSHLRQAGLVEGTRAGKTVRLTVPAPAQRILNMLIAWRAD